MRFSAGVLSLLLSAAGVLGAPTSNSDSSVAKRGSGSFKPKTVYQYNVGTGAIDCTTHPYGLVEKSPANGGQDKTTLLTFEYPDNIPAGATCQFDFTLTPSDTLEVSGLVDVFSSLAPAPGCTSGWGPGNQRNNHLGRIAVGRNPGASVWVQTYGGLSVGVPCKPAGTIEAFELVGVYDYDRIKWNNNVSGASIVYTY